jgi:hypothetical protein
VVRALRTGASRGVRYTMGRARTGILYQVTVWQRYEQLSESMYRSDSGFSGFYTSPPGRGESGDRGPRIVIVAPRKAPSSPEPLLTLVLYRTVFASFRQVRSGLAPPGRVKNASNTLNTRGVCGGDRVSVVLCGLRNLFDANRSYQD